MALAIRPLRVQQYIAASLEEGERYCAQAGVRECLVRFTKDCADELLTRPGSVNPRNLNAARVQQFAKNMRDGNWHMVADHAVMLRGGDHPVELHGTLANGFHRLTAVSDYNVSFVARLVIDCSKDEVLHVDTDTSPRSASVGLKLMGIKNERAVQTIFRHWYLYDIGDVPFFNSSSIGQTDYLKMARERNDYAQPVAAKKEKLNLVGLTQQAHFVFAIAIYVKPPTGKQFLEEVASGANLNPKSPAKLLRDHLLEYERKRKKLGSRTGKTDIMRPVIVAWNAYSKAKKLTAKELEVSHQGDFPQIDGYPSGQLRRK